MRSQSLPAMTCPRTSMILNSTALLTGSERQDIPEHLSHKDTNVANAWNHHGVGHVQTKVTVSWGDSKVARKEYSQPAGGASTLPRRGSSAGGDIKVGDGSPT